MAAWAWPFKGERRDRIYSRPGRESRLTVTETAVDLHSHFSKGKVVPVHMTYLSPSTLWVFIHRLPPAQRNLPLLSTWCHHPLRTSSKPSLPSNPSQSSSSLDSNYLHLCFPLWGLWPHPQALTGSLLLPVNKLFLMACIISLLDHKKWSSLSLQQWDTQNRCSGRLWMNKLGSCSGWD